METYRITLSSTADNGGTPMLMHADNIDWADEMDEWRSKSENRAKSKAGDDRTPPFRWKGCLNYDDPKAGVVAVPSEYIMRCLMEGGAEVPTGKGQKTFKAATQSGIQCVDAFWTLLVNGRELAMKDIEKVCTLKTFKEQRSEVEKLGFSLFVKRARVGSSKHIRVRPRFDNWSTSGELIVTNDMITPQILEKILEICGKYKGLGSWRPGGKTPGTWGMFRATIAKV